MSLLHCRMCGTEILASIEKCPRCGCRYPFSCAVCGEDVGMLTIIGSSYPFSRHGQPLCSRHAQRLCVKCNMPFPPEELSLGILYWKQIKFLRAPMPINGWFCADCKATHSDPPASTAKLIRRRALSWLLRLGKAK